MIMKEILDIIVAILIVSALELHKRAEAEDIVEGIAEGTAV
jgi:hypothetical protein